MVVPDSCLTRLRDAGLLLSGPMPPGHIAFPDGYVVGKPKGVGGHSLPDFEGGWGLGDEITIDAPPLYLHAEIGKWFVTSHDYVPGPGPGDFVREFAAPEEAVADILDFYFGDPSRMEVKRSWRTRRDV